MKRYVQEPDTEHVLSVFPGEPNRTFVLSRLAPLEIMSALTRRVRQGDLADAQAAQVVTMMRSEIQRLCRVYDMAESILGRAEALVLSRVLRAADAIHLAHSTVACEDRVGAARLRVRRPRPA